MRATTLARLRCYGYLVITQLLLFAGIYFLSNQWPGKLGFFASCWWAVGWAWMVGAKQRRLYMAMKRQVMFEARAL